MLGLRRALRAPPALSQECVPGSLVPWLLAALRRSSPAPAPPGLTLRLLCAETKKMATVNIYKDVIQTLFDCRG